MTVLVTGGAGFIGSDLVRRLRTERPAETVRVLDDLSTGLRSHLPEDPGIEFVEGSILDPLALAGTATGVRAIVHLAALGSVPASVDAPVRTHEVNVTGTLAVLEQARAADAFVVFASSSAVYGDAPGDVRRESDPPAPASPYAASKLAAESYVLAYARTYGLGTLALRFFNVYGPRQAADHPYAAVVPRFAHAALSGVGLEVHGDGGQTRDFVPVEVVTRTITTALRERISHRSPVNLASGCATRVIDLATLIETSAGAMAPRQHLPTRAGDVRTSLADVSVHRSLFPDIGPVDLADGVRATLAWYGAHLARTGAAR